MNKRSITLLLILFALCSFAAAQVKIVKYCEVDVSHKVKIFLGSQNKFAPKDTTIFQKLKLVNQLKSDVDVLDYMAQLGWTLVNIHAAGLQTGIEVFYFKKEFDSSELSGPPF